MASVEGLKRKLRSWRPRIQPAFVVYLEPQDNPIQEIDETVEFHEITTPDDPMLPRICAPWQLPIARKAIAAGEWDVIVALKDGQPVGRIWETFATVRSLVAGVPRMKLAKDECLMFDLFVEREFRRSNVGMTMAHYFFEKYQHGKDPRVRYVIGFISYDNGPSVLWHHSIGFNVLQTINYLSIGERIKWKLPFSDTPRFGPMSRRGRHTDASKEYFGSGLLPQ
jgi:hypothetical protein